MGWFFLICEVIRNMCIICIAYCYNMMCTCLSRLFERKIHICSLQNYCVNFFVNYNTCIWQDTGYIKFVCTFVNSNPCNCSMLHAGAKLIDARPNPARWADNDKSDVLFA